MGLDIRGRVDCDLDGHACVIEARGDAIVIAIESSRSARRLTRQALAIWRRRGQARAFVSNLAAIGQRIEIRIDGNPVAEFGSTVSSGLLSIAGLPKSKVRAFRLLRILASA